MFIQPIETKPAGLYGSFAEPTPSVLSSEYLALRLGTQEYGVNIRHVREICDYEQPTPTLDMPSGAHGVIHMRDGVIPVVDLRTRFGLPTSGKTAPVIVVLGLDSGTLAVVVDAVSNVVKLRADEITHIPPLKNACTASLFRGVGSTRYGDAERTLILLNFQGLITRTPVNALRASPTRH